MSHKIASKSKGCGEIGTEDRGSDEVPIPAPGIGTRISDLSKRLGSRSQAAEVIGISVPQLQRYIREENSAPFEVAARLCLAANRSMEWLATGKDPPTFSETAQPRQSHEVSLDEDTLAGAIEAVDAVLEALDSDLSPAARARVAAVVYRRQAQASGQISAAEMVTFTLRSIQEAVADESREQGARTWRRDPDST